jgi:hypothetical protein
MGEVNLMKRYLLLYLVVMVAAFAGAFAQAGSADPTPLGGVDRVMADFTAEVWWGQDGPFPPFLAGVAHIQAHAYDLDRAPITNQFAQTGDVGWTSCDPVGSFQCSLFPKGGERTNILWVYFSSGGGLGALIATGEANLLALSDGGAPGNEPIGFQATRDSFGTFYGIGRIHQYGPLLGGNITIRRY